jgi:hypothetical protein
MKLTLFLIVLCSINAEESQGMVNARQEMEHIQRLIETGTLPPAKMADAQQNLDDAMDEAVLERTLYGHVEESDEQQAAEMLGAAQRRVDREQKKLSRINELIAEDLAPPADRVDLEKELSSREDALEKATVRAPLLREVAGMAHAEALAGPGPAEEKTSGDHLIEPKELKALTLAFEKQFSEPFPISAKGMTAVHRALGLDHTGRVDVAVNPDSPEGVWLREYLDARTIPYYAFRVAMAGKATAPHIHIGPGSVRLRGWVRPPANAPSHSG